VRISRLDSEGFNLIELMVVLAVLSALFAIAIPNYYAMKARALEASLQGNMYDLQLAVIHFSVDNHGLYPTPADDAAVVAGMPNDLYPENPFTNVREPWVWGPPAGHEGALGNAAPRDGYLEGYDIWGMGLSGVLHLRLKDE
jgi:prepilin-type N-terminal cleavage/methylation domain-containing protein